MPHQISSRGRQVLASLVVLGAMARIAALPWTASIGPRIIDEQHYHVLATSLADGHGFATSSGPTSLRPPLYPAFVAGVWDLTGSRGLQPVRIAQIGLIALLAVIVFALGRDLFGERAGVWAAAIVSFYPAIAVSGFLLLTEVLFATLLALACWCAVRAFLRASPAWAAAAGLSLGLAALTRSVVFPLPAVLACAALVVVRASLARRMAIAVALVAAAAIVIAPWAVRNTRLQHVPVIVDTMGGMNLRMGNYEYTPLDRMWDAVSLQGDQSWIKGYPVEGAQWTEGQKDRWARGQAVRFMLAHPGLTAWRSVVKFGDFWALDRDFIAGIQRGLYNPPRLVGIALSLALLAAYPVLLFFVLLGLRHVGKAPASWIPLGVSLFVCALHTIVFAHPRYRLPVMPLLAVYAGAWLARAEDVAADRWRGARLPVIACVGFVILWVVQFVWRDWDAVVRLASYLGVG